MCDANLTNFATFAGSKMRKVISLCRTIPNRTAGQHAIRAAARMRLNRCPLQLMKMNHRHIQSFGGFPRFYSAQTAATSEPSSESDASVLDGTALQLWNIIASSEEESNNNISSQREAIEKCKDTILSVAWKRHEHYRPALLLGVVTSLLESIDSQDEKSALQSLAMAQERLGTDLAAQGYWGPAQKFLTFSFHNLGEKFHFDSCQTLAGPYEAQP